MCAAGLTASTTLITEPSSIALARLASEAFMADAAFVDGSHRFHEVFVDLYYLRRFVRPGGLLVLDDAAWSSVAAALRYYDVNPGWRQEPLSGRLEARRLPADLVEPPLEEFTPFQSDVTSLWRSIMPDAFIVNGQDSPRGGQNMSTLRTRVGVTSPMLL
ncbi:MAG TPA: class I SAM-dependent methyltransferase, partial [Longimicrobiales bacterium]